MILHEERERYGKQYCEILPMLGLGVAGLGMGALGGLFGSKAEKQKNQMMADAMTHARSVQAQTYGDLGPYRNYGYESIDNLSDHMKGNPFQTMDRDALGTLSNGQALQDLRAHTNQDLNGYMDPGMNFRIKQGSNAIMNNAAAAGMMGSGDTLRAMAQYGQDMGSQEYNNAFNRYLQRGNMLQGNVGLEQNAAGMQMGERNNAFNRHMAEAGLYQQGIGMGQQAATAGGQLGNQAAQTNANLATVTDPGASNRIWGNYLGGLGGMALGAAGTAGAGGGSNFFSSLGGLFGGRPGAGMGTGASANRWFG